MEKKKTLASGIIGVIVILILAGIVLASGCVLMLNEYRKQMLEQQYQVSEEYLSGISQRLGVLNQDIRNMLYNGDVVERVAKLCGRMHDADQGAADETTEPEHVKLEYNKAVAELKETFLNMERIYGMSYNFFYYDSRHAKMMEYGESDYMFRKMFTEHVVACYEDGSLAYTKDSQWFIMDGCLCTIHKSEQGVIGCWIRLEDFAKDIFESAPGQCVGIEFYLPDTGQTSRYEQREGVITVIPIEDSDVSYYQMEYARLCCSFILDTSAYKNMILYPLLILILMILYLMFVSSVLIYTKKNILSQVGYFYDNLLHFKDNAGFQENSSVIEFAEAGKVLNELAEEIRRLKIDIYEEQIARQRTELDYLQLQIRPHFYLNCLNVIYSMAEVGRTKEIQEIVLQVSKYLRYIFKRNMDPVTVEKELEFTGNYLKVTECMNRESYPCRIELQEELRECAVPPLLIQTFVENSLKHNRGVQEGFGIAIRVAGVELSGDVVCQITISDNGTGLPEEDRTKLNDGYLEADNSGYHIGIRNAVTRMKLLYGDRASIRFDREEAGGVRVTILIPKNAADMQK